MTAELPRTVARFVLVPRLNKSQKVQSTSSYQAIASDIAIGQLLVLLQHFQLGTLQDLRDMLNDSGAVISGSAALAVFHPGRFMPNDIDFYVLESGYRRLSSYLHERGYRVVRSHILHYSGLRRMRAVEILYRRNSRGPVNIIVCGGPHVLSTIAGFHSTLVMNYIAGHGAICLYPLWTMLNTGLVVPRLGDDADATAACIEKYRVRGFVLLDSNRLDSHSQNTQSSHSRFAQRHLHDGDVLFIPFDARTTDLREFEGPVSWEIRH